MVIVIRVFLRGLEIRVMSVKCECCDLFALPLSEALAEVGVFFRLCSQPFL